MVEASKLLHESGCPDLHLLTSQVLMNRCLMMTYDTVFTSFRIVVAVADEISNRGLTPTLSSSTRVPRAKLRSL